MVDLGLAGEKRKVKADRPVARKHKGKSHDNSTSFKLHTFYSDCQI